jgi:hypothetical protein
MSRENVDLVRRLAEAFNRGTLDAVRPFVDPALVWHEDPSLPEAGVYRGLDEWEAYARQFLAEFSEITYEPGEAVLLRSSCCDCPLRFVNESSGDPCHVVSAAFAGAGRGL